MKQSKPLFMKTYGKQRRKLSAWVSPENRKQAFDTTASTDGDISVFEVSKPTRVKRGRKASVAHHKAMRPAKKKAMLCLTEKSCDEDFVPPPYYPQPVQQTKVSREKKKRGSSETDGRLSKRKAMLSLAERSSDEDEEEEEEEEEENIISRPSSPQSTKQRKTTRKRRLVSAAEVKTKRKSQKLLKTSESEEDWTSTRKRYKKPLQKKTDPDSHPRSAGRFVTRRRRATVAKAKPLKARSSMLNSSDEFTSAASRAGRIRQSSCKRSQRIPPVFVVSSAENSVNAAAGSASFAVNPLREVSLNELADPILGPCPRKPIFCSTPSAGTFSKRPCLKPLSINDQSVSCIGVSGTFQVELDSPGISGSSGLHSQEKPKSSFGEEQPSGGLLTKARSSNVSRSCGKTGKGHTEDLRPETCEEFPHLNLLSTEDSASSSHFVSAAGGLEWLIEALKEKCVTVHCTVQLERLYNITASQLCSQTTYSSCLEHSSSVHSQQKKKAHPLSVDGVHTFDLSQSSEPSCHLHFSVSDSKTSGHVESVNSVEPSERSVGKSQSTNNSPSVNWKQTAEPSASVVLIDSTHHTDMGTQVPSSSPVQAPFIEEEADHGLTKSCSIRLQKWTKEAGLPRDEESAHPNVNGSENGRTRDAGDPEDLTCSAEVTERTRCNDPEAEERAAALTSVLKTECQKNNLMVDVKRLTLSQLKERLQLAGKKPESPTVSDSDDQTENQQLSESDANHCDGDTSPISVSSEEKESVESSGITLHKRKKTSLAPKEKKSTSTDRPGTTRKACVSGLSVNRWKSKDAAGPHVFRAAQRGGNKMVDCSINEMISTRRKQPNELLGTTMSISTPMRVSRLNLSSLLADFTPNTHTWSRIKAVLSVHRKGMVHHTPKGSSPWVMGTPVRAELMDASQDLFNTPFRSSLPKRLRSQLLSADSLVECEDADLSDAEKVYAECGQRCPLPWEECVLPQHMKRCVKIGEGTFGEVFSTTNASGETVALKIIPVEGSELVNGEDQKTFGEILHEIIISKELSSLKEKQENQTRGFIGLNDLHCVQGCYPPDFLKTWDAFDQQRSSENDRPDFFGKNQLFIILEFEFGGIDLENSSGTLASLGVAKSILHQVTAAMAVAEQELHFEHRDLHWGNVLVKPTKEKKGHFLLNGAAHSVETKGVLVRIIDYSLSRLEIDELTVSCDISKDEELFQGHGDYQFDIYRLMREENGNNWSDYRPHTNVLWLHYLCAKLLSMKYRGKGGRAAKDMREALTRFHDNVLQYSSATEALQNCPMFQQ